MLKYNQRRHSDGRFGIYFADRLLATIGDAQEVRSMLHRLNFRFDPSSQGQNDIQPTPRRKRRRAKTAQQAE